MSSSSPSPTRGTNDCSVKLRPNFIHACNPDWTAIERNRVNIHGIYWARVVDCINFKGSEKDMERNLKFALQSWPSGHTMSCFAAATFLSLYLNAKLKAFSDYHTGFWKMILVLLPLLVASYVGMTLIVDHVSGLFLCLRGLD